MRPRLALLMLLAGLAGLAGFAAPARALPLYARATGAPCTRCHLTAPVLNAHGAAWMLAGHREHGAAPADTASAPAASVIAEVGYTLGRADTALAGGARSGRNLGEFRRERLEAHTAGTLSAHVAYHVAASLDSGGTVSLPAADVRFTDVLSGGRLAVRVGMFDAGLPFLADTRRLEREGYLAPVALPASGVALEGHDLGWDLAIGRIDSQRSASAPGVGGHAFDRLEDTYAWAARTFGAQQLGARFFFGRQDSDISWHAWLQRLQLQLGGLLGRDRLWVLPAYTLDRFDDRPAPGIHQRHQYALLEVIALLGADRGWVLSARAERGHVTPTVLTPGADADLEVVRLARTLDPHTRVALEGAHGGDDAGGPRHTGLRATVQLAF